MEKQTISERVEALLQDNGYDMDDTDDVDVVIFSNPDYYNAIIGITEDKRLLYDFDLTVDDLMKEDGMTQEEAVEFIEYNTIRSLVYQTWNKSPIIMHRLERNDG